MIRLKVSPLNAEVKKDKLQEIFEEYGKVDSVKILRGVGENAQVVAFVFMPREVAAEDAMDELQGTEILGS
ncbi:MAG: RNA-binding protein, partial [Bacteroidota bacterium]